MPRRCAPHRLELTVSYPSCLTESLRRLHETCQAVRRRSAALGRSPQYDINRLIMQTLPIDPVLPAVREALARRANLVLSAPPGAGKTTRVPPALLSAVWTSKGRIILLQPRRLAARAAAQRMAELMGEAVGETVGYRVRLDRRVGPKTRIESVTTGLFLRQLQGDPELKGVAAILFDEFHERSLDGDLALALALESQQGLRP